MLGMGLDWGSDMDLALGWGLVPQFVLELELVCSLGWGSGQVWFPLRSAGRRWEGSRRLGGSSKAWPHP